MATIYSVDSEDSDQSLGELQEPPAKQPKPAPKTKAKPRARRRGGKVGAMDEARTPVRESPFAFPGDHPVESVDEGATLRRLGQEVECGRCQTVTKPGTLVPLHYAACEACYWPMAAFEAVGFDWAAVLGRCEEDEEFNQGYEKAIAMRAVAVQDRPWPAERLNATKEMGMTVSTEFIARKENDMHNLVTHQLSADELKEPAPSLSSLHFLVSLMP